MINKEMAFWKIIKGLLIGVVKREESTVMYYQWQLAILLGIEE